ncbi:MAG: hypothetical protein MUF54_15600 [Polyangiaceae bacterium]|jgi:hypothetical protein|nr:hypothetical protein [Polyangiaceae bacterium]
MKGVVTIEPLYATPKRQKRLAARLEENGFTCELRMRFDRLHIIAFEKSVVEGDAKETIYQLLRDDRSWHEQDCSIKILEP